MASQRGIRAGRAFVELFADNSKLVSGLRSAKAKLMTFGKDVRDIGRRMATVGAAIAAPFVASAKVFASFEQQMANVSTMLDQPEQHMKRFTAGVRELSMEFGESTETLSKGLYDILSASIAPADALDVLAVAAKAAKAGLTDTGTAADAITTILNAYGMQAGEAGRVSDVLFAVVKRGKTTFAQLAPSIGMVASTAAVAGVKIEEVGAMLATMTRAGVQTDSAVTALTSILKNFLKPSSAAVDLARQFGFEMNVATLKSEGLVGVMQRLSKLPPDIIAELFPDVRALRGVLPALQNIEGVTDDLRQMQDSAGTTQEAFDKMAETLMHSFNQVKQTVMGVLAAIGEQLAEPLDKAAKAIKVWGANVIELVARNKDLVVGIAKLAAITVGVGVATIAVGYLTQALAGVAAMMTLIAAHPVAAALLAIAAATALIVYHTRRANMAASLHAAAMTRQREEAERIAAADKLRVDRLRELAAKQSRTSNEMREARDLVEQLEKSYGPLNVVIDDVAGSLDGLAKALGRVEGKMADILAVSLDAEIAAIGDEIIALQKRVTARGTLLGRARAYGLDDVAKQHARELEDLFKQIAERQSARLSKVMQQKQLRTGDLSSITAPGAAGGGADAAGGGGGASASADKSGGRWLAQQMRRVQDLALETKLQGEELEQARLDLARKRALSDLPEGMGPSGDFWVNLEYDLRQKLLDANIGGAIADAVSDVTGTFNAAALLGLQSGGPNERMAIGIDKIERNTRTLRNVDEIAFA